ncbi:MAG: hypothetical protein E7158_06285 [Firmicutes bacterium]|nr:hypothetical protein [Bacillota bacterium]
MYENGDKKRFNIDFPTINLKKHPKYNIETVDEQNNDYFIIPKGIVIKFLTVGIFFFIFIFCASKFGTVVAKEYDESSFNPNITYIQKEVISYYSAGNIPKKVDEPTKLTLTELVNKGIINTNNIPKIEECNLDDSYVELSLNKNNTYSLVISINCNGIIEQKEETLKKI